MIHIGKQLWENTITEDMVEKQISEKVIIQTYPHLTKNIYECFVNSAKRLPDKEAVVDNWGRAYSYGDLYLKVQQFSAWLYKSMNVRKGQHVALMLFNSVEFCVAFLALNRIGAVVVLLPTKYRKEEIGSLTEKADITLVICDEKFENYFESNKATGIRVCKIPSGENEYALSKFTLRDEFLEMEEGEETTPSDMVLLMFTSGTTSQSKGVTITNYNIMHAIVSYQRTLDIQEDERAIIPIPMYLITGLVAIFGLMMHVGGTVYLNRFFDAERVLSDVKKYQITFLHASPTVFTLLLSKKNEFQELPSLRIFACGGGNMAPGKIRMIHEWLPQCDFRTVYGLTETTSPGTIFPVDVNKSEFIGSSGIPIPGLSFKIVDEAGNELPNGREGRILVKGSNITEEYYNLQSPSLQDGWLDTGDIGYFNSESYLYIVDRKKDMINRGGEKICSYDVENELSYIKGIRDAAVVGIPDELYGEVPVAVVELQNGSKITEKEIRDILGQRIAKYKVPVKIIAVDKIPLTENSKTDKKKIRQLFC